MVEAARYEIEAASQSRLSLENGDVRFLAVFLELLAQLAVGDDVVHVLEAADLEGAALPEL